MENVIDRIAEPAEPKGAYRAIDRKTGRLVGANLDRLIALNYSQLGCRIFHYLGFEVFPVMRADGRWIFVSIPE